MGKINDLPVTDKPREKAARFGTESLNDEELLAIIIHSGTVGHSSLEIARDLLDDCHYLGGLLNKPAAYFYGFKGLKQAKAITIMATLEIARRINEKQRLIYEENIAIDSEVLYHRYKVSLAAYQQEVMAVIILNKNKQIIYETNLYKGSDNNIIVNVRDIVRLLMIHNGYYFYLIHNHPNGTLLPSENDIKFTKRLEDKIKHLNIHLVDHLIISQTGYYSFLQQKILKS